MSYEQAGGSASSPRVSSCCPHYHEAVELVGRRWTGAILRVLMDGPLRFSEIGQSVPELSDRLLSERMKELEGRGIVQRTVIPGPPVRVQYSLSTMGRDLEPALSELHRWANEWLKPQAPDGEPTPGALSESPLSESPQPHVAAIPVSAGV